MSMSLYNISEILYVLSGLLLFHVCLFLSLPSHHFENVGGTTAECSPAPTCALGCERITLAHRGLHFLLAASGPFY